MTPHKVPHIGEKAGAWESKSIGETCQFLHMLEAKLHNRAERQHYLPVSELTVRAQKRFEQRGRTII